MAALAALACDDAHCAASLLRVFLPPCSADAAAWALALPPATPFAAAWSCLSSTLVDEPSAEVCVVFLLLLERAPESAPKRLRFSPPEALALA